MACVADDPGRSPDTCGRVAFMQGRLASCRTRLIPLKLVCSSEPVSWRAPPVSVGGSLDKSRVSSRVPCMSGDPHGESLSCCFSASQLPWVWVLLREWTWTRAGVTPFHLLHFDCGEKLLSRSICILERFANFGVLKQLYYL